MTSLAGTAKGLWPQGNFWLQAGWLVDGSGGPALRDHYIQVMNGLISSMSSNPPAIQGNHFIDASDATVIPMLMDGHVHLALSGTRDSLRRQRQLIFKRQNVQQNVIRHLANHWSYGVAAVREAGDPKGLVWEILSGQPPGQIPPVTTAMTRWAWHAPGRYGASLGQCVGKGRDLWDAVAEHIDHFEHAPSLDHIKIIQSGINSINHFGRPTRPQFDEQTLSRLVVKAHDKKLKVMVHANGQAAVQSAVTAGCDTIEHGYFMGASNLQRMAERGIIWVPTVIPMAVLARSRRLTTRQRQTAQKTVDHQLAQIHQAHRLGVRIALGTDAGSWGVDHGKAVWEEMRLLISAGLSPEQVVSSATSVNRLASGKDSGGTLIVGRPADFVLTDGSPDQLCKHLTRPMAVCWRGQWQMEITKHLEPDCELDPRYLETNCIKE